MYLLSSSAVIKTPCGLPNSYESLEVEQKIYHRLGTHPCITKFLGTYRDKIILERLQYPLRKRLWDLRDCGLVPPKPDVVRWALQISLGLQHVHSCDVRQVDIGPHNALMDWDENVKLSDFAGSSLDGSEPLVCPSLRSEHPNIPVTPSVRSEIFALGSTLYEVETTRQPYNDKLEGDVKQLYIAGHFPDTRSLVLGKIIRKCWTSQYVSIDGVVCDIRDVIKSFESGSCGLFKRLYNVGTKKRYNIIHRR